MCAIVDEKATEKHRKLKRRRKAWKICLCGKGQLIAPFWEAIYKRGPNVLPTGRLSVVWKLPPDHSPSIGRTCDSVTVTPGITKVTDGGFHLFQTEADAKHCQGWGKVLVPVTYDPADTIALETIPTTNKKGSKGQVVVLAFNIDPAEYDKALRS
jgi:hypothetical protein